MFQQFPIFERENKQSEKTTAQYLKRYRFLCTIGLSEDVLESIKKVAILPFPVHIPSSQNV